MTTTPSGPVTTSGGSSAVTADLALGHPSPSLCDGRKYTIGFDVYSQSESFATSNIASFKKVAAELGCVTPVVLIDNANPATALSNIQTFVRSKVDGVVLANVVPAAQPGILRALASAKIPVVSTYIPAGSAPFIDEDDSASGKSGGTALAQQFLKLHPGVQPYLIIGGFPEAGGASVARMDGVTAGVKSVIPDLPSSHILQVDTKADPSVTYRGTKNVLARIPSGSYILFSAINDENTFAVYQALKDGGRIEQSLGMGLGGDPSGIKYICTEPGYYGTVAFFPETWFDWLLPGVIDLIHGKTLPAQVFIPTKILTKDNAKESYPDSAC